VIRLRAAGSGETGRHTGTARIIRRAIVILWLAGALVIWNVVFDSHIVRGAREYVDRQELFVQGRGPRVDMGQAMEAAKQAGLRAASLWTGTELASGAALWLFIRSRRNSTRLIPR
jgi:hypothetical protein